MAQKYSGTHVQTRKGSMAAELRRRVDQSKEVMTDDRIGPVHVCLFLALVRTKSDGKRFSKQEVKRLAKIKGETTYYRVMKDLGKWGVY